MKRFGLVCLLAVLAFVVSLSSAAKAQVLYASPAGAGGTCTPSAPCQLSIAINDAFTSGAVVSCIDGGVVGTLSLFATLANSFTVDCPSAVLVGNSNTPLLTLNGPSSQVVILRNLTFDGGLPGGLPFIKVTGGATLIIENCRFQNMINANGIGIAIQYLPSSPAAQLIIRDSVFSNNGFAPGSGGGLQVAPAGGSASVKLERVSFDFNVTSMVLSGPVNATMINSTVSSSRSNGILVGSGSTLFIKASTLEYNVGAAVSVASGGSLQLSDNDIRNNQIGISNSGGHALTYSNNRIFGNGSSATLGTITGGQ